MCHRVDDGPMSESKRIRLRNTWFRHNTKFLALLAKALGQLDPHNDAVGAEVAQARLRHGEAPVEDGITGAQAIRPGFKRFGVTDNLARHTISSPPTDHLSDSSSAVLPHDTEAGLTSMKPSAKTRSTSFRYLGRHAPSIRTPLLHATSAGTSHTPLKTTSTTEDHPVDPMYARLVSVHGFAEPRLEEVPNASAERKRMNKRAFSRPVATAKAWKRRARSRSSLSNQYHATRITESRMRIRKIPHTFFRLKTLPTKSPVTVAPSASFAYRRDAEIRDLVRSRVTAKAQPYASKDVLNAVQRGLVRRSRRKVSVASSGTTWKKRRLRIRRLSIEGLLVRRLESFPEAERSRVDAWALMTATSSQDDHAKAGVSSGKSTRALADPASKALADDVRGFLAVARK
ncbi:hypothetical protein LTR17_022202 [Elasticomyces elasticus]|nr:hypothetical protein LTR17_022202 [Elasticomyces elasticus]